MKPLKTIDLRIICELIDNSRLSDRQLAKTIGTSQPTVTRRRTILEKERLLEYTAVPNLDKLGFEILAFTFGSWDHEKYPDQKIKEAKNFLAKRSNVLFLSTGRGVDSDRIIVSVHKSYTDYYTFMRQLRESLGEYMSIPNSFLVSLRTDNILRNLGFKYLAQCLENSETADAKPVSISK